MTELLDSIDARITSRVLRMALFSAARELVGADAEVTPEEGTLLGDRRPLRLTPPSRRGLHQVGLRSTSRDAPIAWTRTGDGDAVAAGEVGADLDTSA